MKIPAKFHNSLTEAPFTECGICQRDLTDPSVDYLIEKAFRRFPENGGEQLLFEIAVCQQCATKMRAQLSKESIKAVNNFFYQEFMERLQELQDAEEQELESHCLISGDPLEELEEYQIYAHCQGQYMPNKGSAYMLSGPVIERIQDLLSAETKEELRRFTDDHLGTPPEIREILDRSPMFTI